MDYIPLRMGASGPAVREVQRMLLHLGYQLGEADGKFGVRTLRAVIAFQSDHELPVDGIVAANTWMALEKRAGGSIGVEEVQPSPPMAAPRPEPLVPPEPPMTEPPPPPIPPQPIPVEAPRAEAVPPPVPFVPLIDWTAVPSEQVHAPEPPPVPVPPPSPPVSIPWRRVEENT